MPKEKRKADYLYSSNPSPSNAVYASRSTSGVRATACSSKLLSQATNSYSTLKVDEQPLKRPRKRTKDTDAPEPEKRGAIFKKACPKTILQRVDRVISQRFYMIDRTRDRSELREVFSVLGSTGNVYTVTICRVPFCDCPDASKGNHCKHILFVFLKVLQVPYTSSHWYQKALLTSELEEIFRNAPPAPNDIASARLRDAFAQATGRASSSRSDPDADAGKKRRVPGEDDSCPICYEGMGDAAKANALTYCEECGNALHRECFQQWAKASASNLTCVWCRAKWVYAGASGSKKGKATYSEGYVNLGSVAGVSPVRDTSSYYHGPRRGGYYGYRSYEDDCGFGYD